MRDAVQRTADGWRAHSFVVLGKRSVKDVDQRLQEEQYYWQRSYALNETVAGCVGTMKTVDPRPFLGFHDRMSVI